MNVQKKRGGRRTGMGELEREIEGRRDMGVVFFVMGFERRARRRS